MRELLLFLKILKPKLNKYVMTLTNARLYIYSLIISIVILLLLIILLLGREATHFVFFLIILFKVISGEFARVLITAKYENVRLCSIRNSKKMKLSGFLLEIWNLKVLLKLEK